MERVQSPHLELINFSLLDSNKFLYTTMITEKFWLDSSFRLDVKRKIKNDVIFRKKFIELGGDGLYSAWYPIYLEPTFRQMNFYGDAFRAPNFHPLYKGNVKSYNQGDCPVVEKLQPTIAQFKTSYQNYDTAKKQADALHRTIQFFGK